MYAGVFPNYDGRRRLYLNASISSPRNFENFFGFGNNTAGYKEEKKNYNRVTKLCCCTGKKIIISDGFEEGRGGDILWLFGYV